MISMLTVLNWNRGATEDTDELQPKRGLMHTVWQGLARRSPVALGLEDKVSNGLFFLRLQHAGEGAAETKQ
jgi:hypothetical protein